MASTAIQISLENRKIVEKAFKQAPKETTTLVKQTFGRAGKRWQKSFRPQLAGEPGIDAPSMRRLKDKNVHSFTEGKTLEGLRVILKISRFLRWHAEGATIPKRGGGGTFRLPARLKFPESVNDRIPDFNQAIGEAALRAVRVHLDKKLKVSRFAVRA